MPSAGRWSDAVPHTSHLDRHVTVLVVGLERPDAVGKPASGAGCGQHAAFAINPEVRPDLLIQVEQPQAHAAEIPGWDAQFLNAAHATQDRPARGLSRELVDPFHRPLSGGDGRSPIDPPESRSRQVFPPAPGGPPLRRESRRTRPAIRRGRMPPVEATCVGVFPWGPLTCRHDTGLFLTTNVRILSVQSPRACEPAPVHPHDAAGTWVCDCRCPRRRV